MIYQLTSPFSLSKISDFEELAKIGKGGFGSVWKVRNKLDGRVYAIKKIQLRKKFVKKLTLEVKTLSRLDHKNVVRYYNAWIEIDASSALSASEGDATGAVGVVGNGADYEEEDDGVDWLAGATLVGSFQPGPNAFLMGTARPMDASSHMMPFSSINLAAPSAPVGAGGHFSPSSHSPPQGTPPRSMSQNVFQAMQLRQQNHQLSSSQINAPQVHGNVAHSPANVDTRSLLTSGPLTTSSSSGHELGIGGVNTSMATGYSRGNAEQISITSPFLQSSADLKRTPSHDASSHQVHSDIGDSVMDTSDQRRMRRLALLNHHDESGGDLSSSSSASFSSSSSSSSFVHFQRADGRVATESSDFGEFETSSSRSALSRRFPVDTHQQHVYSTSRAKRDGKPLRGQRKSTSLEDLNFHFGVGLDDISMDSPVVRNPGEDGDVCVGNVVGEDEASDEDYDRVNFSDSDSAGGVKLTQHMSGQALLASSQIGMVGGGGGVGGVARMSSQFGSASAHVVDVSQPAPPPVKSVLPASSSVVLSTDGPLEQCEDCGMAYRDWLVPNEWWQLLHVSDRASWRCVSCFKSKLRQMGADVSKLKVTHVSKRPEPDKFLYIQMDYCQRTLHDAIQEGRLFNDSPACWRIFGQILDGLVYIHSKGIVHCDLKPTNIFLDKNDDVKIGDFGLATYVMSGGFRTDSNSNVSELPSFSASLASGVDKSVRKRFGEGVSSSTSTGGGDESDSQAQKRVNVGGSLAESKSELRSEVKTGEEASKLRAMDASMLSEDEASGVSETESQGKVGTFLYIPPEGGGHGTKGDMYSAGIILLEMFYKFSTKMERYMVLTRLRAGEMEAFPLGLTQHPAWASLRPVLELLLRRNPVERPSAVQLLNSQLLPPEASLEPDLEKTLATILSNPDSLAYAKLMDMLFNPRAHKPLANRPERTQIPPAPPLPQLSFFDHSLKETVLERILAVFKRHQALHISCSSWLDREDHTHHTAAQNGVLLADGTRVALPRDLRLPFAKYVSQQILASKLYVPHAKPIPDVIRRYDVGLVFRHSKADAFPKQFLVANFDLVIPHPPEYLATRLKNTNAPTITFGEALTTQYEEASPRGGHPSLTTFASPLWAPQPIASSLHLNIDALSRGNARHHARHATWNAQQMTPDRSTTNATAASRTLHSPGWLGREFEGDTGNDTLTPNAYLTSPQTAAKFSAALSLDASALTAHSMPETSSISLQQASISSEYQHKAALAEAETIKCCLEVASSLCAINDTFAHAYIRVSHAALLDAIYDAVGLPTDDGGALRQKVSNLHVFSSIPRGDILTDDQIDELRAYFQMQGDARCLDALESHFNASNRPNARAIASKARRAIRHLKTLLHYLELLNVDKRVIAIAPSMYQADYNFGTVFQLVLPFGRNTLAVGGRYDDILEPYFLQARGSDTNEGLGGHVRPIPPSSPSARSPTIAIGFSLAIERILTLMKQKRVVSSGGGSMKLTGNFGGMRSDSASFGMRGLSSENVCESEYVYTSKYGQSPEAYVVSNSDTFAERLSLASACWTKDIHTRFNYESTMSLEEQLRMARESGAKYILQIEKKVARDSGVTSGATSTSSAAEQVIIYEPDYGQSLSFGLPSQYPGVGRVHGCYTVARHLVPEKLSQRLKHHVPLDAGPSHRHHSPHPRGPSASPSLSSVGVLVPASSSVAFASSNSNAISQRSSHFNFVSSVNTTMDAATQTSSSSQAQARQGTHHHQHHRHHQEQHHHHHQRHQSMVDPFGRHEEEDENAKLRIASEALNLHSSTPVLLNPSSSSSSLLTNNNSANTSFNAAFAAASPMLVFHAETPPTSPSSHSLPSTTSSSPPSSTSSSPVHVHPLFMATTTTAAADTAGQPSSTTARVLFPSGLAPTLQTSQQLNQQQLQQLQLQQQQQLHR